jgi:chromosome partitioning protein
MKTIAVMSLKGGSGKSTLAVHLAVAATAARRRTILVDMDPQRSSLDWSRERQADWPVVVEGRSGVLFNTHCAAQRQALDLMVIDTRPSIAPEASEAARMADLCLIVVRPCFFDLQAVGRTVEMISNLRRQGMFVLNQAPVRRNGAEPRLIRETIEALSAYDFPIAEVGLRHRAAYQSAMWRGLGAQEAQPDSQAAFEINSLWARLSEHLWPVSNVHRYRGGAKPVEADAPLELALAG